MTAGDPKDPLWRDALADAQAFGGDANVWYQKLSSGGGAGAQVDRFVFLGTFDSDAGKGGVGAHFYTGGRADSDAERPQRGYTTAPSTSPHRVSVDESDTWFMQHYDANDATFKRIKETMLGAGLITADDDVTKMLGVWHDFSNVASIAGRGGGLHTPDWYMRRMSEQANQPVTWVTHETTTTRHNPKDLQAAYQGVAQDALGRRATGPEATRAAGVVGAQANASPSTSVTTSTENSATHQRTSNRVENPGMGADAINEALLHQAMQNPEYGAYQAAGHYFPLLVNALSAVNQAGT